MSSLLLYPLLLIIAKSFLSSFFLSPFLVQGPFFSPFYRAQISFFRPLYSLTQCPGFLQLQQVPSLFFRLLFPFLSSYCFFFAGPFLYQASTQVLQAIIAPLVALPSLISIQCSLCRFIMLVYRFCKLLKEVALRYLRSLFLSCLESPQQNLVSIALLFQVVLAIY